MIMPGTMSEVLGHCRAPAVEHSGGADARAEVPGVGGDGEQRFGGGTEQQVVDHRLVLVGDRSDLGWQRENDVEIADRQQIGLAGCKPILCLRTLTLWAMTVAARVVGDAAVAAIFAALDMTAEGCRAALLNGRHDLELSQAHMPGIGSAPVGSMAMKDVCDLEPRAAHGRPPRPRVATSRRSMVQAGRGGWLQPGSSYWRHECKAPGVELGVAQERLDHANIDILLEEVRGEAVPQCVWRHALLDPSGLGGGADGAAELAGRQRLDRVAARKQPASRQQ